MLALPIFGAHDQGESCGPKVSPTVFGVQESKSGLRSSWFPVAGELALCASGVLGGGRPRHNSKNSLKIALAPPHHGQKRWAISSLRIESFGGQPAMTVHALVCSYMGCSLWSHIRVVLVPIFLVDHPPFDAGPMVGPHKVPRGQCWWCFEVVFVGLGLGQILA